MKLIARDINAFVRFSTLLASFLISCLLASPSLAYTLGTADLALCNAMSPWIPIFDITKVETALKAGADSNVICWLQTEWPAHIHSIMWDPTYEPTKGYTIQVHDQMDNIGELLVNSGSNPNFINVEQPHDLPPIYYSNLERASKAALVKTVAAYIAHGANVNFHSASSSPLAAAEQNGGGRFAAEKLKVIAMLKAAGAVRSPRP